MSEPPGSTTNTAESGSTIGIQAGVVQNSTVVHNTTTYTAESETPEATFRLGARYLDGGVPSKAQETIEEAIARGHAGAEVWFHWALATLSKRSYSDLDEVQQAALIDLPRRLDGCANDDWNEALDVVCTLLKQARSPEGYEETTLKRLEKLPDSRYTAIMRHLALVLSRGMKDQLWSRTRRAAEQGQHAGDRRDRIWVFFQPEPIEPELAAVSSLWHDDRQHRPRPWSLALAASFGGLVWVLARAQAFPAIVLLLLAVVLGVTATRAAQDRRFRHLLRDADHTRPRTRRPLETSFEKRIGHHFDHYSRTRAPSGVELVQWLADTAITRAALCEEIIETYQDRGARPDGLQWLIRYLTQRMRDDWKEGRLYAHREDYQVPAVVICSWMLSLLGLVPLVVIAAAAAVHTGLLTSLLLPVVVFCAWRTSTSWVHVGSENRFMTDQEQCRRRELQKRQAEYSRWKRRLEDTRPSDAEMEKWLDCDKKLVLAEALDISRLAWRDVIAYAFLQTPGSSYQRARVAWGPSRYSRYTLRLFLITRQGVREFKVELYFEDARWEPRERNNFRFDAISSVRVTDSGTRRCTLELTLTNGPTSKIDVLDATPDVIEDDLSDSNRVDLDAAGFDHALHVLEGIAAEGQGWLGRDRTDARR